MAESKEITKPKTTQEQMALTLDRIIPLINKDKDFVTFGNSVEPTRDLMLKLLKAFNLSHDTEIVESTQTRFIMKAIVWDEAGHKSASHGLCTLKEVQKTPRAEHDAMTKAETRAIKRAIESLSGASVINQLILHVFGRFHVQRDVQKGVQQSTNVGELYKHCLKAMDALQEAYPDKYNENAWASDKTYVDECRKNGFADKLNIFIDRKRKLYKDLQEGAHE